MESNKQNQFIDVTEPPFNARGDGKTDDAPAFQKAVDSLEGGHVQFPHDGPLRGPNDEQHS
ncbi:MAG: hypothetical protein WD894_16065 [Pirellulales bacterium]